MHEKQPPIEYPLSPEQQAEKQARKERFLQNMENLQNANLEDLYPPEIQARKWEEVTQEEDIKQFWKSLGGTGKYLSTTSYRLYRDPESQSQFIVPRLNKYPQAQNALLDMLATAKHVAPWAPTKGFVRPDQDMFIDKTTFWRPHGRMIELKPAVLESIVNGLGDKKHTKEARHEFLRQDIAALVHENVHIYNKQEHGGFGEHTLIEIAPIAAEYLAFPGKNEKMSEISQNTRKVLMGKQDKESYYDNATLLGMLIMAKHEQLLPENENISEIEQGLDAWQEDVESLPSEELATYRQKVADSWMLSENDEKLKVELTELRQQYPELTTRLLGQQT